MLHPFPFGGSKTSSDGLALGLPVVTLATDFLRGRMASSFYKHMEIYDCIANSVLEYVEIAVRLALDAKHRLAVSQTILDRNHLLFENMEVVHEWGNFLWMATMQNGRNMSLQDDTRKQQLLRARKPVRKQKETISALSSPHMQSSRGALSLTHASLPFRNAVKQAKREFDKGDLLLSQEYMRLAMSIDPHDAGIHNDMGAVCQMLNNITGALHHFRIAINLRPSYLQALNNLGVTLMAVSEFEQAEAVPPPFKSLCVDI
jgi:predicted O-linked N-acetylglucosamine transferase (SPINDLY family)